MTNWLKMHDYPPKAKAYWYCVVVAGIAALALSALQVSTLSSRAWLEIAIGATAAALVALFPVRLPGTKISVTGADIFLILVLLLHGPAAATLAAAVEGASGSMRTSKRITSWIGGPAIQALSMFVAGNILYYAISQWASDSTREFGLFATFVVAFAVLYYAINTLLPFTLIALKRNQPVNLIGTLRQYGLVCVSYTAAAAIAGLLYKTSVELGPTVLVVILPVIALFLAMWHFYYGEAEAKAREQAARAAAAEREAIQKSAHLEELKRTESRFHSAFTHAAIGMALLARSGEILQVNRAFTQMFGLRTADVSGKRLDQFVSSEDVPALNADIERVEAGTLEVAQSEVRCKGIRQGELWVSVSISPFWDASNNERATIVQLQDITDRRRAEARLFHSAHHDSLTGLPNRAYFSEHLTRAIARHKRNSDQHFAVMFLDFDRFKLINDSLGHSAGDDFLVSVSRRLLSTVRATDLVSRFGGDEFAILIDGYSDRDDVFDFAQRVLVALQAPMTVADTEVRTSASIGITFSDIGYFEADSVIRDADLAMYKAKSSGKARYAVFDESLRKSASDQFRLESELRLALERQEFLLEFQPIVALANERLAGLEALVRWRHPRHGVLGPESFIKSADETGLIVPIGEWIIDHACRTYGGWQAASGMTLPYTLHLNVSGRQVGQPGFVDTIRDALARHGMTPQQLNLEITESVLVENTETAGHTLRELRELGVGISIDDFGTGFSSLGYLHRLPATALKIDRSFVDGLEPQGPSAEIVRAVCTLGKSLSKAVIAEGIETPQQQALLTSWGCTHGQGYLFAKPMTQDATALMLLRALLALRNERTGRLTLVA